MPCLALHTLAAALTPETAARTAFVGPEGALSFAQLAERTARFASAMESEGLRAGDRVLLQLPDGVALAAAWLGCQLLGAVAVTVGTELEGERRAGLLARVAPRLVLAAEPMAGLPTWIPGEALEARLSSADPRLRARPRPERAPAAWLFTSGTTGAPRAVIHTAEALLAAERGFGHEVVRYRPDDVVLCGARLAFGYGLGAGLLFPLAAGACVVLDPRKPSASRLAESARAFRPTVLSAVPSQLARLLALPGGDRAGLDRLRLATSAGEPLPAPVAARFAAQLPGVPLLDCLGMTETFHVVCAPTRADEAGTLGRAVGGHTLEVRGEAGLPVEAGTPGRLFVRGPTVASGWEGEPEASAEAFIEGGFLSPDRVVALPDGRLRHLGRVDDLLKVSGRFVAPVELEALLTEPPEVVEALVRARPAADGTTELEALLVLTPGHALAGALEARLREELRRRLGGHAVPSRFEAVETLPRTERGKLRRH